jgi:acetyltransferase-like isoleucine patch superfamily enzyme
MHIGREVVIGGPAAPSHLVTGEEGVLRIGDGVRIGHGAAISSQALVEIGDGAQLGAFVIVMDSDFHVPGSDAVPIPQPVVIGPGAVIGHRVTVMPGARIGDGARIIAGSVVAGVVPEGATARGFPARRVKSGFGT